jgi:hypothetical protein
MRSSCYRCGHTAVLESALQRTDACPRCFSDLKCCRNCRFFDPNVNNQCREPQAEWTPDKEKANFCEFFEFREITLGRPGAAAGSSAQDRARNAFDGLFKK